MRHMTVTLFLSSNYKVHSRRQEKQKFCKEDQKLLVVVGEWNRFCCGSIFLSRLLESNHFFITHHLLLVLLLIAFNIHVLGASKVKSVETDEPIFELIPPLTSRQLFTSSQALDEADADAACVPLETSPNHDWLFWLLVLSCWSGFIFFSWMNSWILIWIAWICWSPCGGGRWKRGGRRGTGIENRLFRVNNSWRRCTSAIARVNWLLCGSGNGGWHWWNDDAGDGSVGYDM